MDPRTARHAVAGALVAGVVADVLFNGKPLGINLPIATAGVLLLVTWFGPRRRPADLVDTWLPCLALAASVGPALRTDGTVVLLDLVLVVTATCAWGFAVSGVPVTRRSATAVAALGMQAGGTIATGFLWLLARSSLDAAFARFGADLGRFTPVIRGAVIAIPIVVGFSILLTSADAVFGRVFDDALRVSFDPSAIVHHGTFAIVGAVLVGGPVGIAVGAANALGMTADALTREAQPQPAPVVSRSGATEALIVIGAVDALFGAFAVIQVLYLFGGTDTLSAIGMTYSDYARQGYFQLVGVVGLAGLLLLGAHAVVGRTRAFLVSASILLVLTAVILASAAMRLALYQGAYGWTELRFYVAASIAWLALCVVLALAMLSIDRMRWLPHGLAMGAAAITLAISMVGPQAFVMHENLRRALDPALVAPGGEPGLDIEYALWLGDDALPDLVAALEVVSTSDRPWLLDVLRMRRDELEAAVAAAGPLSWNLARARAIEALAAVPPRRQQ